ncbi:MAG: hypothetical protein WC827_04590 [Candidatus Paceibacterota bacterium]|jgi:hypothetical protein
MNKPFKFTPWQTIFDDDDPKFWTIFNSPYPTPVEKDEPKDLDPKK